MRVPPRCRMCLRRWLTLLLVASASRDSVPGSCADRRWCPSTSLFGADAKVQAGTLRLGGPRKENHWRYVSKFGFSTGVGEYALRLQVYQPKTLSRPTSIDFELFLDEEWAEVEAMEDVCQRKTKARNQREVQIDETGAWGVWLNGTVTQNIRPHIWFFAVSDCDNRLQNFTHRIRFEVVARQQDGSEFSCEMRGMLPLNMITLAGFTAFIYVFIKRCRYFCQSAESLHPVICVLATAMVLQYLGTLFHTTHLWFFQYNGVGVRALEVISEILAMLAQVIQASLLILIGLGYTLLQKNIGDLDLVIPMAFMVAIIHIMLVGFGKIKDDASYKFHENEGVVGWILLVLRLLLWAWFMWAVQSTAAEGGSRLRAFLRQFRIAGTLYFIGFPVLFLGVKVVAEYWQHGVMQTGMIMMQMASNLWLARLFLTRGEYFKVSTLNASFLPGGARVGLDKEE